jgi:uncharacterized protein
MNILSKLNLTPSYIYETIVTTYNPQDKIPNAAPMGIMFRDEKTVVISPYMTTQTFKNIEQTRYAVINFIYDLDSFFESAFSANRPKLPLHRFKPSKKVPVPCLKDAFAHIEVEALEVQKESTRAKIITEIKIWDIGQIPCFPINRGYNLVLESIIHATRIVEFKNDEKLVGPLIELIRKYRTLVTKVAPGGKLVAIMAQLENRIEKKVD